MFSNKFEYKEVETHQPLAVSELNAYGAKGWELVAVYSEKQPWLIYIFKKDK